MADKLPDQHEEMAPDPEEDDLSDLDDMLDDFAAASIKEKAPPTSAQPAPPSASKSTTNTTTKPKAGPQPPPPAEDDDFAKQLQAGMADLFGSLGNDADMQKQFEEIMKELSIAAQQEELTQPERAPGGPSQQANAAPNPTSATSAASASASASSPNAKAPFLSTIEKTMERMQQSGDSASAAATNPQDGDDFLAQMLKDIESGKFPGIDGDNSDFNSMLMGMMEQLVNKDILYEPMKELNDGYPDWMQNNEATLSAEDKQRYKTQQAIVKDIVDKFERPGYKDDNTEDREYIVEKMQQMQAAGAPPPGLLGDTGTAQNYFNEMDASGCAQQ